MASRTHDFLPDQCHADPHCHRAVCFQIRVYTVAGESHGEPADSCADHLAALVQKLAQSAQADGLADGHLQVSAFMPGARLSPSSPAAPSAIRLPFASITLG